jgi:hypothetical protein
LKPPRGWYVSGYRHYGFLASWRRALRDVILNYRGKMLVIKTDSFGGIK